MKPWLAVAITASFLGIAVFGVFAMDRMDPGYAHSGCIAATVNGAPCPGKGNPLASVAFHLDAFKNFSTAPLVSFMGALLFIALAVAYSLRSLLGFQTDVSLKPASFSGFPNEEPPPIGERIRYWLALHENSPSAV